MSIELPLDKMTLADKLEVMETLWADISKQPEQLPSPAGTGTVLIERRRLVENGQLKFVDWDVAIAEVEILAGQIRLLKAPKVDFQR